MKVSVIIPTWNRGYIIEKSIESVLNQTLSDFEILVCDDGSTDDTKNKVLTLGDARVRWIDGPRGGRPAIPRNRGIKVAKGEWLAFLDSDDEWLPEKLAKQIAAAESANLKAVSSNASRLIPGQGIKGKYLRLNKLKISFDDLLEVNEIITSSAMFHRSLVPQVNGFPESEDLKALEDYALWLRVACLTDFAYLEETLTIYRDDPANSVRGQDIIDAWEQKRRVLADFIAWSGGRQDGGHFTARAQKMLESPRRPVPLHSRLKRIIKHLTNRFNVSR